MRCTVASAVVILGFVICGCSHAPSECAKTGRSGPAAQWASKISAPTSLDVSEDCGTTACETPAPPCEPAGDAFASAPAIAIPDPVKPTSNAKRDYAETEGAKEVAPRDREPLVCEDRTTEIRRRQERIRAGRLTAGSFDDHARYDDYKDFLSKAQQNDTAEVLPRLPIGRRVMIHVRNAAGSPVGDARVVIRPADSRRSNDDTALLDVSTASDGRAIFLTGNRATGDRRFSVTVDPIDGSESVTRVLDVDQAPWTVTLPEANASLPTALDLALIIDTTGSMGDELEYLKMEISRIADTIHRMFPNVDQRYALITYRDQGDAYVTRTFDFTESLSKFQMNLRNQSAGGGGDYPEAMDLALQQAEHLSWRTKNTARVAFLVGDAPPHDHSGRATLNAVAGLAQQSVRVFPVAGSGARLKAEFVMRATSFLTLGQYLFLTDHSGIGNPHAAPHVPDYQVEHLNRLMIRMIASELAGKRLVTVEVIAIETGKLRVTDPIPVEPQQQPEQQTHRLPPQPERHVQEASTSWKLPRGWSPTWTILGVALLFVCVVDLFDRRRAA